MNCQCLNRLCSCFQLMWVIKHQIISILCHKNLPTTDTYVLSIKTNYRLDWALFNFLFNSFQIRKFLITGSDPRATFSREIDTAKLAGPFIASHLLWSLEGQSIDRYNIVQWTRQRGTGRDSFVFCMFWEHEREMLHFDTETEPTNVLFLISQSAAGAGEEENWTYNYQ